jgi:hypothetical protein
MSVIACFRQLSWNSLMIRVECRREMHLPYSGGETNGASLCNRLIATTVLYFLSGFS